MAYGPGDRPENVVTGFTGSDGGDGRPLPTVHRVYKRA